MLLTHLVKNYGVSDNDSVIALVSLQQYICVGDDIRLSFVNDLRKKVIMKIKLTLERTKSKIENCPIKKCPCN